jgi:membrane dipeptidase
MARLARPIARTIALGVTLACALLVPDRAGAGGPVPVVDLHVDLSYQVNYKNRSVERASGQLVARTLVDAGVVGLVLPLYVPNDVAQGGPRMSDIESSFARMLELMRQTPPYLPPGARPEAGRVATWFALEGAAPFAGRPEDVAQWVTNGVRIWGLVHVHDNALATSAGAGPRRRTPKLGLSTEGRRLVHAIHAAHGIVDVSHASDQTIADVLRLAREDGAPVVATHSNADHVVRHARNLTDAELRAIAATNGVIGVNFHGKFLARGRPATLDDVVKQIRYMVALVGVSHVGLGSDFEGEILPPAELSDATCYQSLAHALTRAGFSDADIASIFSGNIRRLLEH